jgi:hypothetical protein
MQPKGLKKPLVAAGFYPKNHCFTLQAAECFTPRIPLRAR